MFGFRWEPYDLLRTLARFAKAQGVKEPPPVKAGELHEGRPEFEIEWVDLRAEKKPSRGKSKGQRPWERITGITLHQTAVVITRPERCLGVPVHGCVLPGKTDRSCVIVLLHDPTDYMYHANGFNRRDVGIEVSCRAAGIEGDGRTLWLPRRLRGVGVPLDHCTEATDGQLEGCRRLIRYYCDAAEQAGGVSATSTPTGRQPKTG